VVSIAVDEASRTAACPLLLADGGHYSPRNARYDWLTLNHFAVISGGGAGVTLSNSDCYFFRLGVSTASTLDTATPQFSVLAGGQVDGPGFGIPDQGGDSFLQRFALTTHGAFDPTKAVRFALEHQNPLITGTTTGGNAYPERAHAFLRISDARALLWALKPGEDGIRDAGVVARLWNVSDRPVQCTLGLDEGTIASARRTTHIETGLGQVGLHNGRLPVSLAARQMRTYAFKLSDVR
jgi:alpha-mannosidase